jgi:hypothetical protein
VNNSGRTIIICDQERSEDSSRTTSGVGGADGKDLIRALKASDSEILKPEASGCRADLLTVHIKSVLVITGEQIRRERDRSM